MKDCQDFDLIRVRPVEYAVRKPSYYGFANIGHYDRVHQRLGADMVEHALHLGCKRWPQACSLRLVPIEGLIELGLRFSPQDYGQVHCLALARARALTTSQGVTASG